MTDAGHRAVQEHGEAGNAPSGRASASNNPQPLRSQVSSFCLPVRDQQNGRHAVICQQPSDIARCLSSGALLALRTRLQGLQQMPHQSILQRLCMHMLCLNAQSRVTACLCPGQSTLDQARQPQLYANPAHGAQDMCALDPISEPLEVPPGPAPYPSLDPPKHPGRPLAATTPSGRPPKPIGLRQYSSTRAFGQTTAHQAALARLATTGHWCRTEPGQPTHAPVMEPPASPFGPEPQEPAKPGECHLARQVGPHERIRIFEYGVGVEPPPTLSLVGS